MRICRRHCIILVRRTARIDLVRRSRGGFGVFGFNLSSFQVFLPFQKTIPGISGNEIFVTISYHSVFFRKISRSFAYEGIWGDTAEAQGFVACVQDELG